jgi:uncharacterized protein YbjQ (UPF0145 family)
MASCPECGKSGFGIFEIKNGQCPSCRKASEAARQKEATQNLKEDREARKDLELKSQSVVVSTEAAVPGDVERLGIVASEVVFCMNIFKDIAANFRDLVGGRSGVVQKTLKDARQTAFREVKLQAAELGANAVIAVDIDYNTISTGSSTNMMMVSVSGTAVVASALND